MEASLEDFLWDNKNRDKHVSDASDSFGAFKTQYNIGQHNASSSITE